MSRLTRGGTAKPSRETKFSGTNGDREELFFPIQLTTSRIGNLTRLILTLVICDDHRYTYVNRHAGTPKQRQMHTRNRIQIDDVRAVSYTLLK